jgi:hypothetical protein
VRQTRPLNDAQEVSSFNFTTQNPYETHLENFETTYTQTMSDTSGAGYMPLGPDRAHMTQLRGQWARLRLKRSTLPLSIILVVSLFIGGVALHQHEFVRSR